MRDSNAPARANPAPAGFEDTWSVLIVPPPHLGAILAPSKMGAPSNTFQQKLDHVLVATDFSEASKGAVLYATSIARRNQSKGLRSSGADGGSLAASAGLASV